MCKMCLLISDQNIKTNIDEIFFNNWSSSNKDGFGYFAIQKSTDKDKPYKYMLYREKKTRANARLKTINPKSLFMLHCRQATEGHGNHPFISEDRHLMLVHNGMIHNYKDYKKELIKNGHKFKTSVDSELLLHAYEDIAQHDHSKYFKAETVKAFIDKINEKNISGWINLILLSPQTQEWIAFSDGSLSIARPYNNLYTIIATELDPLSKVNLLAKDLEDGEFVIGKGSNIITQDKTKTLSSAYTIFNEGYGNYGEYGDYGDFGYSLGNSQVRTIDDSGQWVCENGTWKREPFNDKLKRLVNEKMYDTFSNNRLAPHDTHYYIRECDLLCCELKGMGKNVKLGKTKCFNCTNIIQMINSEIGYRVPLCSRACYKELAEFIDMEGYTIDNALAIVKDKAKIINGKLGISKGLHVCPNCNEIKTTDPLCSYCTSEQHKKSYDRYRASYVE